MARQPLTEVVQVRLTKKQAAKLHSLGNRMKRRRSDVVKPDGAINLSATVRGMIEEAD